MDLVNLKNILINNGLYHMPIHDTESYVNANKIIKDYNDNNGTNFTLYENEYKHIDVK